MIVLLDIGNTAVTYGTFKKSRFSDVGCCLYNNIPKIVKKYEQKGLKKSLSIVISSVVPKITQKIKGFLRKKRVKVWVAGENLPVPLRHRYPKNQKPGIDRLVSLYGAQKLYKAPLLLIDFGTAITFDYLSPKGIFEGGMIVPGPELSFQALIQRAALIPKKLRLPRKAKSFLGTNTLDCLSSGVLEGYGALTDGLIERFKSKYGKNLKVIATGGFAAHLQPYSRRMEKVDPQHTLKSLLLLYQSSCQEA